MLEPSSVYLDYAATTPVEDQVIEEMTECMSRQGVFGNPASQQHEYGWQAGDLIALARHRVASLINARESEILFTSGATESINLALKGSALHPDNWRRHIVTTATEHKAVLDTCAALEQEGFEVTYLRPERNGIIALSEIEQALTSQTLMVSLLHVNNETGVIQDAQDIAELCHRRGVLFHLDASQSVGKIRVDVAKTPVDLMSFSAHKLYGPKGVGALYLRKPVRRHLSPLIHGGGQQYGLRSGTLPTQQIVGLGKACEMAELRMSVDFRHLTNLYKRFVEGVIGVPGLTLNGDQNAHFPGIVNLSAGSMDGEELMMRLKRLAISSGSACSSADRKPSHVLRAMGLSHEQAHASLRVSFGRHTTEEEVNVAVEEITRALA